MNLAYSSSPSTSWQQALIDSIEVGILIVNTDFVVEEWNQFLENHSGVEAYKAKGHSLFTLFKELDQDWLKYKCQPVVDLKTPVFMIWEQRPYLFKLGVARPVTSPAEYMYQNVSIFPITNDEGDVERICFIIYDVTDQALGKQRIEGLNDQLKEISRVDGLTGLFNRRYWQERFEREYKLTVRNRKPISLLIMDIDHFKKVNDTYGHQAGDAVIQQVSSIIQKATRETDIAGRYGGEEFVVLLPDTPGKNAITVAERIRKVSEKTTIIHEGVEINITVSAGVAEFSSEFTQPLIWLEAADQSLYKAKNTGRNQVCLHKSE